MTTTPPQSGEQRPCWFVGAAFGGTEDQTERFIQEGIWEAFADLGGSYGDRVKSIQVGDRIAIKSWWPEKRDLPSPYQDRAAWGMDIQAIGTVTENMGDGVRLRVGWSRVTPARPWYFYAARSPVWAVESWYSWNAKELIHFTFENGEQSYGQFLQEGYWPAKPDLWNEFITRVRAYLAKGELDNQEVNFKLHLGNEIAKARQALFSGSLAPNDWQNQLRSALEDENNNLINRRFSLPPFMDWLDDYSNNAREALLSLWGLPETRPIEERIQRFADQIIATMQNGKPLSPGVKANIISVLLMGISAERYPPYQFTPLRSAYKETGYSLQRSGAPPGEQYAHALHFLDQFIEEADQRGVHLRHRLDAQSVVWALNGNRDQPDADEGESDLPGEDESTTSTEKETIDLPELARTLYFPDPTFLEDIAALLEDKPQVIFQGPPGTGKTYVARALAKHLADSTGSVELVQFHPSYAYEDFVQGYRPELTSTGQPSFALKSGPLLRAADRATGKPTANHYLIIDEINRGNLAKVFGELYFLLEYRDEAMRLQYSDQPFSLPKNLYIIGTMNTADRSIALVDLALRRRFAFVEFDVGKEPVNGLLRRYLSDKAPAAGWVAKVVELANQRLDDRRAAIGPSYFMSGELTPERIDLIWNHSVIPYLEEHLFDDPGRLVEFDLEALRELVDFRTETENAVITIVKSWLDELGADSSTAVLGDPENIYSNRNIKWIRFTAESGSTHPACAVRVDDNDHETVDIFAYEMRQKLYIVTPMMRGPVTEMANHRDRIMNYAREAIEGRW